MFVNILKIQNSEVQIFLLEVSAVFWVEPGYSKIAVQKKKKKNQWKWLKILKINCFGAQFLDIFSIHFIIQ